MRANNKMDEKQKLEIKEVMGTVFDELMKTQLKDFVHSEALSTAEDVVKRLRAERAMFGKDITGMSDQQKKDFVDVVRATAFKKAIETKSNSALYGEQDETGGYLIATEVANAILRIAASVGFVLSQASVWPMATDELSIPNYTGAFLKGEYLGVNAAGSDGTQLTFGAVKLITKDWQLPFVLNKNLLADASVELADWLLALGGESLANMIDYQAIVGTGAPFVGIMSDPAVAAYTLPATETGFSSFDPITDAADVSAQLEESVLDGACWVFERSVWAKIRAKKTAQGVPLLNLAGLSSPAALSNSPTGGGPKPRGEMDGYPVFTVRHMPGMSASAISTKFGIFGNFKAFAFGKKGPMSVEQYDSGTFAGKEIALANQRALILKQRHALVNALPAAFVTIKTAAA